LAIFTQGQISQLLFKQRNIKKVLAQPNQHQMIAHDVNPDTSEKVGAWKVFNRIRQVHGNS
jgi:hypothetical protein